MRREGPTTIFPLSAVAGNGTLMHVATNHRRRGATAVEFAMVAPTFFLLALGVFEFGRGFMVVHLLNSTARQTCRMGIIPGKSTAAIQSLAANTLAAEGIKGATTTVYVNNGNS